MFEEMQKVMMLLHNPVLTRALTVHNIAGAVRKAALNQELDSLSKTVNTAKPVGLKVEEFDCVFRWPPADEIRRAELARFNDYSSVDLTNCE